MKTCINRLIHYMDYNTIRKMLKKLKIKNKYKWKSLNFFLYPITLCLCMFCGVSPSLEITNTLFPLYYNTRIINNLH